MYQEREPLSDTQNALCRPDLLSKKNHLPSSFRVRLENLMRARNLLVKFDLRAEKASAGRDVQYGINWKVLRAK